MAAPHLHKKGFFGGVLQTVSPFGIILLATAFSVLLQGFAFPTGNNVFHVPVVLEYFQSAEGPHDLFTGTLKYFVSGFWVLVRIFANEDNIYFVFFAFYIATKFSIFLVLWLIVTESGSNLHRTGAALVVSLLGFFPFMLGISPIGGNEIIVNYLTHSLVVIPFILLSWVFLFQGRYAVSALCLGVAFNINAFAAIWGAIGLGLAVVLAMRTDDLAGLFKCIARMSAAFLVPALPTVIWIIDNITDAKGVADFDFRDYLHEYTPHHSYIYNTTSELILLVLMGVFFYFHLAPILDTARESFSRGMKSLFSIYMAVVVVGVALPYVTQSRLLLNLYPLRMDAYLIYLLVIASAFWVVRSFRAGNDKEQEASVLSFVSLLNGNVLLLALSVSNLGDKHLKKLAVFSMIVIAGSVHVINGESPVLRTLFRMDLFHVYLIQVGAIAYFCLRRGMSIGEAYLGLVAVFVALLPAPDSELDLLMLVFIYAGLAMGVYRYFRVVPVVLFALVLAYIFMNQRIEWLVLVSAVVLSLYAMSATSLLGGPLSRVMNRIPLAGLLGAFLVFGFGFSGYAYAKRGGLAPNPEYRANSVSVQAWAREHTPPDTVFLPIGVEGFSTLSRRPVWIDWKIGAMVMWSPETYDHWSGRVKKLTAIRSIRDAVALATKEGVTRIVYARTWLDEAKEPVTCVLYRNPDFVIGATTCDAR